MTKKPYVICAPQYSKSAGCRVLFKLAELLEEKGYTAYVFAPPSDEYKKCRYITPKEITDELRGNAIMVYPEVVFGNPLQFQNVVRYVLYFPGKNGGAKTYHNSEMIFTFFEEYYPSADVLFISTMDRSLFYQDDTPKTTDCYFVYKNGKWRDVPEFKDMVEINMSYPKERSDLAALLRKTKNFYSYDPYTLLLDEATACGCNVFTVTEDGFKPYTEGALFLERASHTDAQIESFIKKTQEMHYSGQPEAITMKDKMKYWQSWFKYFLHKFVLLNSNKDVTRKHYYIANRYLV